MYIRPKTAMLKLIKGYQKFLTGCN